MPAVTRLLDVCSGHPDWPSRPNNQGCSTVYVNNRPMHCNSHSYQSHCCICGEHGCHSAVLSGGASRSYAENLKIGRIGDAVSCGGNAASGSPNVFCE